MLKETIEEVQSTSKVPEMVWAWFDVVPCGLELLWRQEASHFPILSRLRQMPWEVSAHSLKTTATSPFYCPCAEQESKQVGLRKSKAGERWQPVTKWKLEWLSFFSRLRTSHAHRHLQPALDKLRTPGTMHSWPHVVFGPQILIFLNLKKAMLCAWQRGPLGPEWINNPLVLFCLKKNSTGKHHRRPRDNKLADVPL